MYFASLLLNKTYVSNTSRCFQNSKVHFMIRKKKIYLHKKTTKKRFFYLVHSLLLNSLSTERIRNDSRNRDHQNTYSPLIWNKITVSYVMRCSMTFFIYSLEFPDKIEKRWNIICFLWCWMLFVFFSLQIRVLFYGLTFFGSIKVKFNYVRCVVDEHFKLTDMNLSCPAFHIYKYFIS